MTALERRLRAAVVRVDLLRATGVRHAWRRWQYDHTFRAQAAERQVSVSRALWREAAEAMGATLVELSPPFAEIRRGEASTRVMGETTVLNNLVSVGLADDKPLTHRLLSEAGLPTPEHVVAADCSAAAAFLACAQGPCVVKPARASGGDGVSGEVRTQRQLRRAAHEARRYDTQLLVERQVPGEVYRVLVLDGQVLDVVRRRAPSVRGDGRSTIGELVTAEYKGRLATAHDIPVKPFVVDLDCIFTLEAIGLRLDDVLPLGTTALVKTVSNFNRPEENEPVAEPAPGALERIAVAAASVLGLRLAGVDIVMAASADGVLLEVNGRPALHHHRHVANRGDGTPVAARVLEALL